MEDYEKLRVLRMKNIERMTLMVKWALAICIAAIIMGIGAIVSSYFLIRLSKMLGGVEWGEMFNLGIFMVMLAIAWRIAVLGSTPAH